MELPINQFKQALTTGQTQYGLWLGLPDPSCAEICASAGFDWLLIDTEHAPYSMQDVLRQLQAIAAYNVSVLVRPVEGNTAIIKQLLDVGAQTLLVPMVDTPEQARQLVQAVRYPPQGIRGLGTSMARAARWNRVSDYIRQANDQICLIVQAETVAALKNLAAIAAVDGVDAVFIGPSDLSASMGYPGNPSHPDVVTAIEKGFKTILNAGKAAGVLAVDSQLAKSYSEKGASFIGVGVDAALLANASQQLVNQFKPNTTRQNSAGY